MTPVLCFLAALVVGVLGLVTGWFALLVVALLLVGAGAATPTLRTYSLSDEEFETKFQPGSAWSEPVAPVESPAVVDPDAAVVVGRD